MAASSGFKNLCSTPMNLPRNLPCTLSRSRTHLILTLLLTLSVLFLLSASLPDISPALAAASFASRIMSASNYISSFSTITSLNTHVLSNSNDGASTISAVTTVERPHENSRKSSDMTMEMEDLGSCDIFDGHWVVDDSTPLYKPGSCPYIDDAFNCFKNGRSDSDYLRLRWKPHECQIPRFNGRRMLSMLRGKRLVFVGDSLNRNMWESLVCALRESLVDKSRVFEVSGRREFKTQGFYSFRFIDYSCSIDFVRSPFLVQEWKITDKTTKNRKETLRLDMIEDSSSAKYQHADIIIFNTGHWWTHHKTYKGNNYFQEGDHIYHRLEVKEAYTKALRTWAQWIDANINAKRTRVFFRGYSASHFKGGQWNSGGNCDGETQPITNDTYLGRYPWMMNVLESVISEMKTPVLYMNITKMSDYRKDGHPSIYRQAAENQRSSAGMMLQDCSHWCLPGVPDLWNELLYTTLLISHHDLGSTTKSVEFL